MKHARSKRARLELRKTLRNEEVCPHCSQRTADLEAHIKKMHAFICNKCGKAFKMKQQWVNHMRDVHQCDEKSAIRDEKVKTINEWLKKPSKRDKRKKRTKSQRTGTGESRAPTDGADCAVAMGGMEVDKGLANEDHEVFTAPPRCVDCGAEAPATLGLLAQQGLTFRCMLLGRACGGNAGNVLQQPLRMGMAPQALATPSAGVGPGALPNSIPSQVQATMVNAANIPIPDDDDDDL